MGVDCCDQAATKEPPKEGFNERFHQNRQHGSRVGVWIDAHFLIESHRTFYDRVALVTLGNIPPDLGWPYHPSPTSTVDITVFRQCPCAIGSKDPVSHYPLSSTRFPAQSIVYSLFYFLIAAHWILFMPHVA